MEWEQKDSRREVVFVDIDELVPQDHLLRKIEKVHSAELNGRWCGANGR